MKREADAVLDSLGIGMELILRSNPTSGSDWEEEWERDMGAAAALSGSIDGLEERTLLRRRVVADDSEIMAELLLHSTTPAYEICM